MPSATSSKPGRLLAGRYRLERPLARGAMGELWTARDETLDRVVAIKLISSALGGDDKVRRRFRREARAAARLRSPHVVPVFDHGDDEGLSYIVMELLEGEDLEARLKRIGRCPLENAVWVADQVSKGLTEAHEAGVIHRDLKPANLFLAHAAGEEIVKILDFGIARLAGFDGGTTMTGELVGSPYYMSPEQALGTTEIDHRSDLFAFGTILFNALTNTLAFEGPSLALVLDRIRAVDLPPATEVVPELPPALDEFFVKAMARDRAERFGSAREMAASFADACGVEATAFPLVTEDPRDGDDGEHVPTQHGYPDPRGEAQTMVQPREPRPRLVSGGTEVMAAPEAGSPPDSEGLRTHVGVSRSVDDDDDELEELRSAGWWARPPRRSQRRRIVVLTVAATAVVGMALVFAASQLGPSSPSAPGDEQTDPFEGAVDEPEEAIASKPAPQPARRAHEAGEGGASEGAPSPVDPDANSSPTASASARPTPAAPKPAPVAASPPRPTPPVSPEPTSPPTPEPPEPEPPEPATGSTASPKRLKLGY